MQILFLILMFALGAVFGSFLCCQARRLHGRVTRLKGAPRPQLREDGGRKRGRTRPEEDYPSRSICLHCHKKLKWYDNIPIISWLALGGKCRFCHKKIGSAEIISELAIALSFLTLSVHFLNTAHAFSPDIFADSPTFSLLNWLIFATTLLLTLSLGFLAIYDGLYGELPSLCLTISIICAIILVSLRIGNSFLVAGFSDQPTTSIAINSLLGGLLFGGIYLALYLVSKGKWVGDGDWLLALAIGLALGSPWLAIIALFIANFSACIIMLPSIKKRQNHQIYFGPFLVAAFVITATFSDFFLSMI